MGSGGWRAVRPTIIVSESDKELVVTAELPGLDDKGFRGAGDLLTIKCEKKAEHEQKNGGHPLHGAPVEPVPASRSNDADGKFNIADNA